MSLYGNVKRVATNTFQFDRIYNTRVEMERDCTSDGVYAGRYVLIEYGERYETQEGQTEPILMEETALYTEHKNADLEAFGANYDSTVWQKIYVRNPTLSSGISEKYIMVAELNALAPKIELELTDTYNYRATTSSETGTPNLYLKTSSGIEPLQDTIEEQNLPKIDEYRSNEQTYLLTMPRPLELDVNENIQYNDRGFDKLHGYERQENNNYIAWTPVFDENDIVDGVLTSAAATSKKELQMNLPAFGNAIGDIYDTLFGAATSGEMRPFFENHPEYLNGSGEPEEISAILSNNSEGLAGILTNLIGEKDPVTGAVKFYLYADWPGIISTDVNTPSITNKPKVVFNTQDINLSNNTHYTIDFHNWQLNGVAIDSILKGITIAAPNLNDSNDPDEQYNTDRQKENQENALVSYNEETITIQSTNDIVENYELNSSQGNWVGLDIDLGYATTTGTTIEVVKTEPENNAGIPHYITTSGNIHTVWIDTQALSSGTTVIKLNSPNEPDIDNRTIEFVLEMTPVDSNEVDYKDGIDTNNLYVVTYNHIDTSATTASIAKNTKLQVADYDANVSTSSNASVNTTALPTGVTQITTGTVTWTTTTVQEAWSKEINTVTAIANEKDYYYLLNDTTFTPITTNIYETTSYVLPTISPTYKTETVTANIDFEWDGENINTISAIATTEKELTHWMVFNSNEPRYNGVIPENIHNSEILRPVYSDTPSRYTSAIITMDNMPNGVETEESEEFVWQFNDNYYSPNTTCTVDINNAASSAIVFEGTIIPKVSITYDTSLLSSGGITTTFVSSLSSFSLSSAPEGYTTSSTAIYSSSSITTVTVAYNNSGTTVTGSYSYILPVLGNLKDGWWLMQEGTVTTTSYGFFTMTQTTANMDFTLDYTTAEGAVQNPIPRLIDFNMPSLTETIVQSSILYDGSYEVKITDNTTSISVTSAAATQTDTLSGWQYGDNVELTRASYPINVNNNLLDVSPIYTTTLITIDSETITLDGQAGFLLEYDSNNVPTSRVFNIINSSATVENLLPSSYGYYQYQASLDGSKIMDYNFTTGNFIESPTIMADSHNPALAWWRSEDHTLTLDALINAHGGWQNNNTNPNGHFWQPASNYINEITPSGSVICLYDGDNIENGVITIKEEDGGYFTVGGNDTTPRRVAVDVYLQFVHNDNSLTRTLIGTETSPVRKTTVISYYIPGSYTFQNCKQINLIYIGGIENGSNGYSAGADGKTLIPVWPKMYVTIYKPGYDITITSGNIS